MWSFRRQLALDTFVYWRHRYVVLGIGYTNSIWGYWAIRLPRLSILEPSTVIREILERDYIRDCRCVIFKSEFTSGLIVCVKTSGGNRLCSAFSCELLNVLLFTGIKRGLIIWIISTIFWAVGVMATLVCKKSIFLCIGCFGRRYVSQSQSIWALASFRESGKIICVSFAGYPAIFTPSCRLIGVSILAAPSWPS